ncbi:MAG: hypothetical protein JJV92_03640, partial [Desulfosarcina sp.]|nr:hypothetical protein [Desulfobacterales bacterium]
MTQNISRQSAGVTGPGSDFKGNLLYLVLASLGINLLAMAMPIMMLQTYDRILPN